MNHVPASSHLKNMKGCVCDDWPKEAGQHEVMTASPHNHHHSVTMTEANVTERRPGQHHRIGTEQGGLDQTKSEQEENGSDRLGSHAR